MGHERSNDPEGLPAGQATNCRIRCNKIFFDILILCELGGFMFGKFFIYCLITTVGASTLLAQTPEPNKGQPLVRTFSWSSDDGYLGVQTVEVTRENFAKFGLRDVRGVAIDKVIENSPAAASGLQAGDVIVRFNGEEITSSRKLTRLVTEVTPDHSARLTVIRAGSEREFTVVIGKRPMPKFDEGTFDLDLPNIRIPEVPDMPMMRDLPRVQVNPRMPEIDIQPFGFIGGGRQIGIGIVPLSKQLAEHFGVSGGVLIDTVRPDSPAAKAGLKAGDIIVEADGAAVKGDGELVRAIREKKEGQLTLTIVRGGERQNIKVVPEEVKGLFDHYFEAPVSPATPGKARSIPSVPLDQFMFRGRVI